MIDVPETLHSHRERDRLTAQGRCTDDDSTCTANSNPTAP
jgi:hypothetical protein